MNRFFYALQAALLLFCSCFTPAISAEEAKSLGLQLNTGFYYPSLNDMIDRKDIEISLKFWLQEITKSKDLDVTGINLYDNIKALRDAFNKREIDYFVAPPLAIVKHFNIAQLADGFYGIREGGKNDSLLLIANSERITGLQDMAGKRLLIPYGDELAEVFLDTITLKVFNKDFQHLFSEISYRKKMKRMIFDIFFNRADVALVYQSAFEVMVEMNPQISERIKLLQSYPVQAKNFSYFHRDYPLRDWVVNEAVTLSTFPRGRQILEIYQTTELGVCHTDALQTFANLYQQYIDLKQSVK